MITLSTLKQDLEFSRGLGDIIDVLKTTALAQFRSLQLREKINEEFVNDIESCFSTLRLIRSNINHPYFFAREGKARAIVVVASDEGFLGGLTTSLVNAGLDQRASAEDEIIVLGERGARYLEDVNADFTLFPGITDEINYKEVEDLRDYLINGYRKGYKEIVIVYPEFISLSSQKITTFRMLPYQGYNRAKGPVRALPEEVMVEPSFGSVLEVLVELWMGVKLLEIFWSSKQSECAARIMHLEGSTQELTQLNRKLTFEYFRQVHSLSDKTIREISVSRNLLIKSKTNIG
ncbi:MAG: FoF1 ATP synthase subunit gamma [Candidatus Omnitrophota bacterium]